MAANSATNLEAALAACGAAGREAERETLAHLSRVVALSRDSARQTAEMVDAMRRAARDQSQVEDLRVRLEAVRAGQSSAVDRLRSDIEGLRRRQGNFHIALFGRTMAGKSTLMEILTRGDGRSIGKGGQRTTRDVRTYSWRGLSVTDVPGVAAFEGANDETTAYEAAASADMILFLLTDDAPQPVEAEHLARVARLGRPLLVLCNVKSGFRPDRLTRSIHEASGRFDTTKLDQLYSQFERFVRSHGGELRDRFLPVHLHARYLADQREYADHRPALIELSRFSGVEERIVREVVAAGVLHRKRAWMEAVAVPVGTMVNDLVEDGRINRRHGLSAHAEAKRFGESVDRLRDEHERRIHSEVDKVFGRLAAALPGFCDANVENGRAPADWGRRIEAAVQPAAKRLLDDANAAAGHLVQDEARRLEAQFNFDSAFHTDVAVAGISDHRRNWRVGTAVASGVLGIGALFFPPLGIAAAVVGLLGLLGSLFDSKDEKLARAREKMEHEMRKALDRQQQRTCNDLLKTFRRGILDDGLIPVREKLFTYAKLSLQLADVQRLLGLELAALLVEVETQIVRAVVAHVGRTDLASRCTRAARIDSRVAVQAVSPAEWVDDTVTQVSGHLRSKLRIVSDHGGRNEPHALSPVVSQLLDQPISPGNIGVDNARRQLRLKGLSNGVERWRAALTGRLLGVDVIIERPNTPGS